MPNGVDLQGACGVERFGQWCRGCCARAIAHRVGAPSSRVPIERGAREVWLALGVQNLVCEERLAVLGLGYGKWDDGRRAVAPGRCGDAVALDFNTGIL